MTHLMTTASEISEMGGAGSILFIYWPLSPPPHTHTHNTFSRSLSASLPPSLPPRPPLSLPASLRPFAYTLSAHGFPCWTSLLQGTWSSAADQAMSWEVAAECSALYRTTQEGDLLENWLAVTEECDAIEGLGYLTREKRIEDPLLDRLLSILRELNAETKNTLHESGGGRVPSYFESDRAGCLDMLAAHAADYGGVTGNADDVAGPTGVELLRCCLGEKTLLHIESLQGTRWIYALVSDEAVAIIGGFIAGVALAFVAIALHIARDVSLRGVRVDLSDLNLEEIRHPGTPLGPLGRVISDFRIACHLVHLGHDLDRLPTARGDAAILDGAVIATPYCNVVEMLDLSRNRLQVLPRRLTLTMEALVELHLADNMLLQLPDEIGTLRNLKLLDCSRNALEHLPDGVGRLKNLGTLLLQGNRLAGLPDTFGGLVGCRTLNLRNNQLARLPADRAMMPPVLNRLSVRGNRGLVIPEELDEWLRGPRLCHLSIDSTALVHNFAQTGRRLPVRSIIVDLCHESAVGIGVMGALAANATDVAIEGGLLAGASFPATVARFAGLKCLQLAGLGIGSLPAELTGLTKLVELKLGDNRITELPGDMGRLTCLEQLELHGNPIRCLPESMAMLRALHRLTLPVNTLEFPMMGPDDRPESALLYLRRYLEREGWSRRRHRASFYGHEVTVQLQTTLLAANRAGQRLPPELWLGIFESIRGTSLKLR